MKQLNKEQQEKTFVNDIEYEMPQLGFKFVYVQAVDPDFAANLVNRLSEADSVEELKDEFN